MSNQEQEPKILLVDIETSPILGYTWTTWDANVLKVLRPSMVICVAWKWLGKPGVSVKALPDYSTYRPGQINDNLLIKELWKILDEADVVVAHNGDQFDVKKLNAAFVRHNLNAPSMYKTIDTKKVAKKYFRFDSNKLDDLGGYLGEGHKMSTGGFELWDRCIEGDEVAWARMKRYNVQDIRLLERVYLRLRPFITNHPNVVTIAEAKGLKGDVLPVLSSCPTCGSKHLTRRGTAVTQLGIKQRLQCNDCGAWSSGPLTKSKNRITGN